MMGASTSNNQCHDCEQRLTTVEVTMIVHEQKIQEIKEHFNKNEEKFDAAVERLCNSLKAIETKFVIFQNTIESIFRTVMYILSGSVVAVGAIISVIKIILPLFEH